MNRNDVPINTMTLVLTYDEDSGEMNVKSEFNVSETMDSDDQQFLNDVFNGLYLGFEPMVQTYAYIGQITRMAMELDEELCNRDEIIFEPDEELIQAIADNKIIHFDKKKLN